MDIKIFEEICYQLYKYKWIKYNIPNKNYEDTIVEAYIKGYATHEDYIKEFGFANLGISNTYKSKEAFLQNEFENKDVMEMILENQKELYNFYIDMMCEE